jgi:hypothetical protein
MVPTLNLITSWMPRGTCWPCVYWVYCAAARPGWPLNNQSNKAAVFQPKCRVGQTCTPATIEGRMKVTMLRVNTPKSNNHVMVAQSVRLEAIDPRFTFRLFNCAVDAQPSPLLWTVRRDTSSCRQRPHPDIRDYQWLPKPHQRLESSLCLSTALMYISLVLM